MMKAADTQEAKRGGRPWAGGPWTEEEMAKLHEMAPQRVVRAQIIAAFPSRTWQAARLKLHHTRKELGIARYPDSRKKPAAPVTRGAARTLSTPFLSPDDPGIVDYDHRAHKKMAARGSAMLLRAIQQCQQGAIGA